MVSLTSTGSAHLIDEHELDRQHYSDINRILGQTPGVYIQEEDGFGLRPNIGIRVPTPVEVARSILWKTEF